MSSMVAGMTKAVDAAKNVMLPKTDEEERERAASLRDAETKANLLFDEIERDLLRAGVSEKELSDEIHALGTKRHGIKTHWHKRVIRSGPNTLLPFTENLTDRIIQEDDVVFVDLGPVFEAWEADFGRTFVLGNDPHKEKLRAACEPMWHTIKARYRENPNMTGEELYDISCEEAKKEGWVWGAYLAGHIIGDFPHERIPKDKTALYIVKGNKEPMSGLDKKGFKRHWILEVHLHDPDRPLGGFFEQLLTVD